MDAQKQVLNPPEVVVVPPTTETPAQEVVNQAEPTSQPEENQGVAQPEPIPVVPATNLDVDEFGVPWKNRAMEYRRKSEELADRIPQMIEEKLKAVSSPQTPQYTYEQLEAYKLQNTSNTEAVTWATGLQRKMEQEETIKQFEKVVGEKDRQRDAEVKRQQSFEYVKNTYPDALNPNHPMSVGIRQYMSIPEIGNNPQGLVFAAKAAYADYAMSQTPVLQQKSQQLKQEVRQLQKGQLIEGGGRKVVQSATPQQGAMDNLRKTGSVKDAESAIGAILKMKGILQE